MNDKLTEVYKTWPHRLSSSGKAAENGPIHIYKPRLSFQSPGKVVPVRQTISQFPRRSPVRLRLRWLSSVCCSWLFTSKTTSHFLKPRLDWTVAGSLRLWV